MSELVIDHQIFLIDSLMKMGKGDKGRLLYLRNALICGKTIYESDKKYLKQMEKELSETKNFKDEPDLFKNKQEHHLKQKSISKPKDSSFNKISAMEYDKNKIDISECQIQSIQALFEDIRMKDSKIKNNLEMLLVNRKIYSNIFVDNSSVVDNSRIDKNLSSGFLVSSDFPNIIKKSSFFGLKKHDLMAYVSAGLFSLWFSSYMNLINLGSMRSLTLGLCAGSAVAAGLFFKRAKNHN